MKCISVVGARPQFVKAAAVSRVLKDHGIHEKIAHTGQHYDYAMSQVFFDELGIPAPAFHLSLGGGNHGEMTGKMLMEIEKILTTERPDLVLVYGDTNSTLAGALAAAKLHIPVAHVEAGLRSFNRIMPEEVNRVLTDHISDWLFCSSAQGVENLKKEGVCNQVYVVGDVMLDANQMANQVIERAPSKYLPKEFSKNSGKEKCCLLTLHRAETTDNPEKLKAIIDRLNTLDLKFFCPLHPRTKKVLEENGMTLGENIIVLDSLSYLSMIALLREVDVVFTDSGGLQKEAYWNGKLCLTLRSETEWVETVDAGWNIIVGDRLELLEQWNEFEDKLPEQVQLYGNGQAAALIAQKILNSGQS